MALVADVENAFLHAGLQPDDRDVARFLWLRDPSKPTLEKNVQVLRFTRVPFGMISSPFPLTAIIKINKFSGHYVNLNPHLSNKIPFPSPGKSVVVLGEYSLHPPPEVLILLLSVISEDFEFRGRKFATSRFFHTIVLVTKDAKTANNWNAHKRKVTSCQRRPKQQP